MSGFLKRLFGSGTEPAGGDPLSAQSQLQSLRMQLEERDQSLARLKADLERERSGARGQVDETIRARTLKLMQAAAAPAAQLALQGHLLEAEGKPVNTRDVLAVAHSLVRALEAEGLAFEGKPGERVTFDANRHEALSSETRLASGQAVVVKLPALSYQGQLLRKAGVVAAG